MSYPKVKVKLLTGAKMPTRAYEGDVGYDLYAREDAFVLPGAVVEISTGVRLELPKNVWCQVNTRSSFGKKGLIVHHGVIDPGYTGEITIWVINPLHDMGHTIKSGDKIAQLIFHTAEYVDLQQTARLTKKTERGEKGFGSSGR